MTISCILQGARWLQCRTWAGQWAQSCASVSSFPSSSSSSSMGMPKSQLLGWKCWPVVKAGSQNGVPQCSAVSVCLLLTSGVFGVSWFTPYLLLQCHGASIEPQHCLSRWAASASAFTSCLITSVLVCVFSPLQATPT